MKQRLFDFKNFEQEKKNFKELKKAKFLDSQYFIEKIRSKFLSKEQWALKNMSRVDCGATTCDLDFREREIVSNLEIFPRIRF